MPAISRVAKTGGGTQFSGATEPLQISELDGDLNAIVTGLNTLQVVNADVHPSAAIAGSKLNLAGHITNAMVAGAAAIAGSKLQQVVVWADQLTVTNPTPGPNPHQLIALGARTPRFAGAAVLLFAVVDVEIIDTAPSTEIATYVATLKRNGTGLATKTFAFASPGAGGSMQRPLNIMIPLLDTAHGAAASVWSLDETITYTAPGAPLLVTRFATLIGIEFA